MMADCSGVIGVSGGQFLEGWIEEAGAPRPFRATVPGEVVVTGAVGSAEYVLGAAAPP